MAKRYTKADVDEVLSIGAQMANLCFNIGQHRDHAARRGEKHAIEMTTLTTMYELQQQWDAAVRKLHS